MADFILPFTLACASFDINSPTSVASLTFALGPITQTLAQSKIQREQAGEGDAIWPHFHKIWRDLSRAQMTFWDNGDSEDESEARSTEKEKQNSMKKLCVNFARFTRNLVAEVHRNQKKAFQSEPAIRRLLHYYTSWSSMKDGEAIAVARVLSQVLVNLVTGNDVLISKLWNTYMCLPEDQVVLIRLLGSKDSVIVVSALIFILNCIAASRTRTKILTRSAIGVRVCVSLLDDMVHFFDAEDNTDGARAFDIGYEIFSRIMAADLVPSLFCRLAIPEEIITPHQTTLLKLVDSYLQAARLSVAPTTPSGTPLYCKLRPMLSKSFFSLSHYAIQSIRNSLGPAEESDEPGIEFKPPSSLDVMLPKVCEALVLVTQCIVTLTLESSQSADFDVNSQAFFNEARSNDQGLMEILVELLRLLDAFLPRINFGKPVQSGLPMSAPPPEGTGFNYLKRDLVRLLGILCHETKAVQDRARLCGGIEVVMNLCVVDERNPYLREHAIFTLHNLLDGNPANQAVVDSIRPSGNWDDRGVLQETVGAVRK